MRNSLRSLPLIRLKSVGMLMLAPVLVCCGPLVHSAETSPDILFIMADDMGYGDVGCFNPKSKIKTPHIDRLAGQGMRFTDAHAPGSVCVPTRYGLMTGRYPFRRNLKVNPKIDPDRTTIASLLRQNGYTTAMVGKWHLGFEAMPEGDWSQPLRGGPLDRGFDTYFGIPSSLDIPPYYYIRGRAPEAAPTDQIGPSNSEGWTRVQGNFWRAGGIAPGFRHDQVLPRFEQEVVAVIDAHGKQSDRKPLFLYVALAAPHTPWVPTAEFRGSSSVELYGDFVMQVDATVGRILETLDQHQMTEDTLVIFTSDNGPVWNLQDINRFDHRSTGPLRGMKGDSWEGGHRMPFVARWPGHIPADSVCSETICFTDMLATFAALVGDEPRADLTEDSYSILPLLRGAQSTAPVRHVTIHKRNATAIRAGRWKLVTHRGSGGLSGRNQPDPDPSGPPEQLYDLELDIGETNNLWAARPAVVQRLKRLLKQYQPANN